MKICNHFNYSTSVEEALISLRDNAGQARILAGGTDLLLDINQGRVSPVETLIDITRIQELNILEEAEDHIYIGSAVLHRDITNSSIIINQAQALSEASGLIGGPQVRNVATLGGNVAHALPAADGTIALIALDAQVEIATLDGRRKVSINEMFVGPGKSALHPQNELLTGFYLSKIKKNQGSAFKRIMRPQGVAIALLNCAIWLEREGEIIKDIRISIGPSGPIPKRLELVENALRGSVFNPAGIEDAYQKLLDNYSFRTSKHRASQEYREEMARVLLFETIELAWKRASVQEN